jgi:hypothetical protein
MSEKAALAPNIKNIKKKAMDTCKSKDHRMTTFTGYLINLGNESFFSALCKDCHRGIRVFADGAIKGEAFDNECVG